MAEWDALPPRRKQRRIDRAAECNDSAKLETEKAPAPKLAESLLSSKDGCASEFYECGFQLAGRYWCTGM
jgi:hypothetical protein